MTHSTVAIEPAGGVIRSRAAGFGLGVDGMLFLLAVLLLPLSGVLQFGLGRIAPSDILFGFVIILLLSVRARDFWTSILRNPIFISASVLVVLMIVAGVVGHPPTGPWQALLQAVSLGFYLLAVVPLFAYYGRFSNIVWTILAGWVLVDTGLLILGIAGVPGTGYDTGNGRFQTILTPVGTLASNAASLSAFFAFIALRGRRMFGALGVMACVLTINLDQSRTALIVLVCMFPYFWLVSQLSASKTQHNKWRKVGYAAFALLMIGFAAFIFLRNERYQSGDMQIQNGLESVDLSRALGYRAAIQGVIDHPFLGDGFQTTRDPIWGEVIHNGYLQLSSDIGVPAGLAFLAIFVIPLHRMWRSMRRLLRQKTATPDWPAIMASGVAFFAVLSLTIKTCFHPLGLTSQDWLYFMAAAPAYYKKSSEKNAEPSDR